MRYFTVEITPTEDGKGWQAMAETLPSVRDPAPTGVRAADGFVIAPETTPVTKAFEELRVQMLAQQTDEISRLTASALALAKLKPQFDDLRQPA